ncbi:MAG: hypothetical protein RL189_2166 [Pseudomonadota bacterium]|jgi:hypothetical protein
MSRQSNRCNAKILATLGACVALIPATATQANAQGIINTEQYQDLFINAGYSALFGAALGTAVLPFLPSNSVSNLRVIAGGASIGFVAGSVMALYNLRQQQNYGMQYYPEVAPEADGAGQWQWDIGSSTGKDVFVKMDSRF